MEHPDHADNSSKSKKKGWKHLLRILFVIASLALLFWLLDKVGWDKISEMATRLGWLGMSVVLGLGIVHSISGGLALKKSILEDTSFPYVHVTNQVGAIVNRMIPWEAGEVVKVTLLSTRVSSKAAIALSSASPSWRQSVEAKVCASSMVASRAGFSRAMSAGSSHSG